MRGSWGKPITGSVTRRLCGLIPEGAARPLLTDIRVAGGAEGDRTPDLIIANDALSQLSYDPEPIS